MLYGLNSFRFFAFLMVFLYHMGLFKFGYMGVHAFFVLSGFLLTPILIEMKQKLPTKKFFIHFYGRRSLRIFPLYFFYLFLISFIAFIALEYFHYDIGERFERTLNQIGYALTYTYNFYSMSSGYKQTQTLTHFWSLAVEEQFYLLWPFFIYMLHQHSIKKMLLLFIFLGPIIRFIVGYIVIKDHGGHFNNLNLTVYTFTLSNFDAFAIGGYCALYNKPIANSKLFIAFLVIIGFGFLSEYYSDLTFDIKTLGYGHFMKDSYKYIWGYSVFSILFGFLLINIKHYQFFPCLMEHPYIAYLGKISYGLYVYHFPLTWFVSHELGEISTYFKAIIILLLTFFLSVISYHLLEAPLLKKKNIYFPHSK
jgi:peptidoglycan/LPS O-acetylase OafA/YrhL